MASTFVPHPRTTTATICSASSLLLLRFTLSSNIHFYRCKRFLGRNNTATTRAPHERCQHPLKGALLLANYTTDLRLFWRFFLSPLLKPSDNWRTLAKTLHHDIATVNLEFIFFYITDQSESLFRNSFCQAAEEPKGLTPLLALLLISICDAFLTTYALLPSHLSEKLSSWTFQYYFLNIKSSLIQKNSLSQKQSFPYE